MPIEIRELHIKAVIDSGGEKGNGSKQGGPGGGTTVGQASSGEDMQQIVDLCVEKVLEILKDKQER